MHIPEFETLEDVFKFMSEANKMPDFDNIKLKDGVTVEQLHEATKKILKHQWTSDRLLERAVQHLEGASVEMDLEGNLITVEDFIKECEEHLGYEE